MKTLISKEYYLTTFMKIIKGMKCDLYLIMNDMIIGTNKDRSYLSIVNGLNNGIPDNGFIEITKEFIKEIENILKECSSQLSTYDLLYERCSIYGKLGRSDIFDAYTRLGTYISSKQIPDYSILNCREIEEFNEMLKLKSAAGAVPFRFGDKDVIYVYPGLLGINKSDRISMNYYKIPNINMHIAEFIIDKKFIQIHKYIGYEPLS